MCKHSVAKTRYISWIMVLQRFKEQKWPSPSLNVVGNRAIRYVIHDFLLVFHSKYVSILQHLFIYLSVHINKEKHNVARYCRLFLNI